MYRLFPMLRRRHGRQGRPVFPGVLDVVLVDVLTSLPDVDERIWAVIGNLAPAYVTDENVDCSNATKALDEYVGTMFECVEAVEEGRSVDGVIPANVPPAKEWTEKLPGRLEFIEERILPDYKAFLS